MWYLYLDESGDLGFDFVNKKPSKFFTVTILTVSSISTNKQIAKAVKVTIRRKLNPKKHRRRIVHELKGRDTTLEVKKYFYNQIKNVNFGLYAITLNKRGVYERLTREKSRIYNWMARQVIEKIPNGLIYSRRKLFLKISTYKALDEHAVQAWFVPA